MARLIQLQRRASEGERRTAEALRAGLPDDWVVVCNALVVRWGGAGNEVDFIVVGDHGVYVIDDKSYNGAVVAGRGHWKVGDRQEPNPVEKIEMVARTVASQLREGVPGLSAALGESYYVYAYVSLSGRCELRRQDVDSTTRVVATDQLAQALRGLDQLPSNRSVPIAEYRDAIVDYVTAGRDGAEPGEADPMIAVDPGPSPGVPSQAEVLQVEEAKPQRRHRKLLWLPVAALVALTIACAWMYWSSRPVSWDAAADRLGKTATVYGPVVQSSKKPRWGDLSYINVGREFRPGSPTPFYLRIDPEYRAAVEAELRQRAAGSSSPWVAFGTRTIWVKGRLLKDDFDGVFMLVKSANDIHLGEPASQSGFLIAGLVCALAAVVWSLVLLVAAHRRSIGRASAFG